MVFNSLTFVLFLAIVFGVHSLPISWRAKKMNLLVASYLFYAAWNPPFVVLIWISTIVDWVLARRMYESTSILRRRLLLGMSLGLNLGLLVVFKYGNFLLESFTSAVAPLGIAYAPPELDIVLPVGISFYTFQTLSYTIDVYRRRLDPWHSFTDFALFVTFFPQLVAGPIVRASEFLKQLVAEHRPSGAERGWALTLLVTGLFEKVVLADAISAPVADAVFAKTADAGLVDGWIGTLAFANQIFFDFAGYSSCAIGTALLFGFTLPVNFRFPYAAVGFSDFWQRWHISLSSWLRDYLYISLGGNRGGTLATFRNLALTMLLGGLWHGAHWRFVIWGGLHGLYLVAERLLRRLPPVPGLSGSAGQMLAALITFGLVCIAWVFFRATSWQEAWTLLQAMFGARPDRLSLGATATLNIGALTTLTLISHWWLRERSVHALWLGRPWWQRAIGLAAMLVAITISPGDDRVFIYFQF